PAPVVEYVLRANEQVRTVSMRVFRAEDYIDRTQAGDEDFRKYFEENPAEFQVPESVKVEYVVLRPEDVAARVELDPRAVREYYEQNKSRFGTPEARQASHMLVNDGDGGSAAARARA